MRIELSIIPVVEKLDARPKKSAFVPMYRETCLFSQNQRNVFEAAGLFAAARRCGGCECGDEAHGR